MGEDAVADQPCLWIPLFVYGSLMRGGQYHHLLGGGEFVAEDCLPNAQMYDLGPYPMVIWGSRCVYGERYRLPVHRLPTLDALEEHPHVYERQWADLASGESAWVYVGRPQFTHGYAEIIEGKWLRRSSIL
ncbi:MAG: gamma-glutamylcyclotransferase family protein [Cyanobacteriota bacterium]|nr:gamma-glutamylcyclotransferase family protein [Cyanobacteriota bacterium]